MTGVRFLALECVALVLAIVGAVTHGTAQTIWFAVFVAVAFYALTGAVVEMWSRR